MEKALRIINLSKIYHDKYSETPAIDNLNFSVNEKEIISIVGPSGCGKSTLLGILTGLISKSHGNILFNGKKKLAYMLQTDSLMPWRTIFENCLIGLEINHKKTSKNITNVENLLKKYGLYEFKDKYPNSLSGGMRQRVALIRTLAINPDILLLDEPYSALDYQTRLKLSDDLYKIIKEEGKTAILITHDIAEPMFTKRVINFVLNKMIKF